jgi:hypothetical protein
MPADEIAYKTHLQDCHFVWATEKPHRDEMSRMISRTAAYSGRTRTGCMALFLPSRLSSFHARSASTAKVTRPVQALQEGLLAFSSAAHDAEKAKIFNAMINMALVNEEAQEAKWEAKETAWGWERKSLALRVRVILSDTLQLVLKLAYSWKCRKQQSCVSRTPSTLEGR